MPLEMRSLPLLSAIAAWLSLPAAQSLQTFRTHSSNAGEQSQAWASATLVSLRCDSSGGESWRASSSGQLISATTGMCVSRDLDAPVGTGGHLLTLRTCWDNDEIGAQKFSFLGSQYRPGLIVVAAQPTHCLQFLHPSLERIRLASVPCASCEGDGCLWILPSSGSSDTGVLRSAGGMCLGIGDAAPLPHTCEAGSPSYDLPFCNTSLPVEARVQDLLSRLDVTRKVQQFSIPVSRFVYNSTLNLKGFSWDMTCMRGIAPGFGQVVPLRTTTVYPHAIGIAATWDTALYTRIGVATALEGRIINVMNYNASGGTSWQGVHCDGGPLANTMHDPRWGRSSEVAGGEDPYLTSVMGVTGILALQNRSADGRWLATSQVTRHYLGYHSANDLPNQGEEFVDYHGFADQQELPYRSFQVEGGAEGIMVALSAFSIGRRDVWNTSAAPMTPSTVHPYLWAKLRDEWGSQCFVQTDCCDALTAMVMDHHYYPDMPSAIVGAVNAGLQASYGPNTTIDETLTAMLQDGRLDQELFDLRISRTLLTRFRLGEFDAGRNPDYPYAGPFNASDLDGPVHRALAREAAAASVVLLRNVNGLLPLSLNRSDQTLAVIGPFADCNQTLGSYSSAEHDSPLQCSYLHSYNGQASAVTTILGAVKQEAASRGFGVTYEQGSNLLTQLGPGTSGLDAAVVAAASSDVTLLVVALSSLIEAEGVDRYNLTLPAAQQALVDAVSAATTRLILVVISGGTVDTSYERADAAIAYFYPGEEAGSGLVDVLFGRVSPSGRLPLTVYRDAYTKLIEPVAIFSLMSPTGVGRTYRYLNETASGGAPGSLVHYWFGYGLSYSKFTYTGLSVSMVSPRPGPGAPYYAPLVHVNVSVANAGPFLAAAEVVEVYVTVPTDTHARNVTAGAPIPKYSLQWFRKVGPLAAGAAPTELTFTLPVAAFETTTEGGGRIITGGSYVISVSGHLPDDAAGLQASNVVSATLTL